MRSNTEAVAHLCEAQRMLARASELVIKARLTTIQISDRFNEEFRGSDLERKLDKAAGDLTEEFYDFDDYVRELAALIQNVRDE